MKGPSEHGNQSLARGLTILEAYTAKKPSWGVRELGRELGLDAATTYRLVSTLAKLGYLEQNPKTQKYQLGPKVVRLAANYATQNSLIELALRVFAQYAKKFPYNFYLGVMSSYEVIYIAVYETRGPLTISTEPGQTVSLHGSAIGKLLLANESDEFIKGFLSKKPPKQITPQTVTSEKDLLRQIKEIRELGYAINKGEIYSEIAAVAAPVTAGDGSIVAGLSLSFPLHYLDTKKLDLNEIITLAKMVADEISAINRRTMIR